MASGHQGAAQRERQRGRSPAAHRRRHQLPGCSTAATAPGRASPERAHPPRLALQGVAGGHPCLTLHPAQQGPVAAHSGRRGCPGGGQGRRSPRLRWVAARPRSRVTARSAPPTETGSEASAAGEHHHTHMPPAGEMPTVGPRRPRQGRPPQPPHHLPPPLAGTQRGSGGTEVAKAARLPAAAATPKGPSCARARQQPHLEALRGEESLVGEGVPARACRHRLRS